MERILLEVLLGAPKCCHFEAYHLLNHWLLWNRIIISGAGIATEHFFQIIINYAIIIHNNKLHCRSFLMSATRKQKISTEATADKKDEKQFKKQKVEAETSGGTAAASSSSSAAAESEYQLPEDWKWVLEIFDTAHLPKLGLPVRWDTTQKEHQKIVFDPETKETITIKTEKTTKPKKPPVGFIMSTTGYNPMPGTETPAAVRYERFQEPKLNEQMLQSASGDKLIPCLVHGDYVKVESLQADHMQAKENIMKRQKALVDKLNSDPEFAKFIMEQDGMEKFFIKVKDKYYGTLFFYELYFNDIDNIWLICQACNLQKSNQETLDWLKDQWLYGEEFLEYLARHEGKDDRILKKTEDMKGLAQVAIDWFWDRHANYISITKKLLKDVATPVQVLNIKLDRVIGTLSKKRAARLQASMDFRLALLTLFANVKGFDMPRTDSESPHPSSDEDSYLKLEGTTEKMTVAEYRVATARAALKLKETMAKIVQEEAEAEIDNRPQTDSQSSNSSASAASISTLKK